MSRRTRVLVTGAGGFIGHNLVSFLKDRGYWVRGVDRKRPEFEPSRADEFLLRDLRYRGSCLEATQDVDDVYALAADMGGMGFISCHQAEILYNNALINLHTLESSRQNRVSRFLLASSACVYPEYRQQDPDISPLKESAAYPAQPQDTYGWEKLTAEQLCQAYRQDFGMETHIVRFHNIFGPLGCWRNGREKAPAALCRKVAMARLAGTSEIRIWGDGQQTRSFCYIDDCLEGIFRLMQTDFCAPLNLGQDRMITINQLADTIADIAGIRIRKEYVPGPEGVRGRNSDNTLLRQVLGWEPRITLEQGLRKTYRWVEEEVRRAVASGELRVQHPASASAA